MLAMAANGVLAVDNGVAIDASVGTAIIGPYVARQGASATRSSCILSCGVPIFSDVGEAIGVDAPRLAELRSYELRLRADRQPHPFRERDGA